jgi:4-oxalocrotonate tautomerase family enzyme
MPHIIVKLYPGRSEERKKQLAREIAKSVVEIAACKEKSVSIAIEEVEPDDWAEKVYKPDIINNKKNLVVTPGYNPFQKADRYPTTDRIPEFKIRPYQAHDESAVIDLWHRCNLVVPQNEPKKDIEMKLKVQPDLFFVGTVSNTIVATVMAGYDGHRGWINYLAVHPSRRGSGFGRALMDAAEERLLALGCPKINLQVREDNEAACAFYQAIGYQRQPLVDFGKRLIRDD